MEVNMNNKLRFIGNKIRCGHCMITKPTTSYHKNRSRADGYGGQCKDCANSYPPRKVTKKGQSKGVKRGTIEEYNRSKALYSVDPALYEAQRKFTVTKSDCEKKDRPFKLSFKQFHALVLLPCNYCDGFSDTEVNGVDRIDSKKGYVTDNCVPCCSPCNLMKFTHNLDFFISHVLKIAAKQGK